MTITNLTTLDATITITDGPAHMLAVYSRILEERPDAEGSRYYDMTESPTGPAMAVDIDGIPYEASGVILPGPLNSDTPEEVMMVIVRTSRLSRPRSHIVFTCYTQYSQWDVKMDVLQIEDDDRGTLDDFLGISIDEKRRRLGLI